MTSRFWASSSSGFTFARGFRFDTSGAGAGALINAPTYSLQTAAGVVPATWNVLGDSTFQPGMFVHQQFASDSGFTTPVPGASAVDYYTQVEGSDWEAGSDTIGNGMVSFIQPSGTYYTRCRLETIPGDTTNNVTSAWSNTVTDTITTATAILSTTDSSPYLTRDNSYQAHSSSAGTNFMQLIRANVQQANQKAHWEVAITKFANEASPAGSVGINLMDSSGNEAIPVGPSPGQTIKGFSFIATRASTTANLYYNGANHNVTLSSAPAIGDTLSLDHDYTAHTVHARYQHLGGALDDLGTITMTSQIPAVPFAACSVFDFVDASNYDAFTFNPGNAAWAITPDTGFTYYA